MDIKTRVFGILDLATVGYGDVYPVTPLGKLSGSVVVTLGFFALPTGVLASGKARGSAEEKGGEEADGLPPLRMPDR